MRYRSSDLFTNPYQYPILTKYRIEQEDEMRNPLATVAVLALMLAAAVYVLATIASGLAGIVNGLPL